METTTATKCMILNPYTKTIKFATITPNLATLTAILGTEHLGTFKPEDANFLVLHSEDIWDKLTGTIAGTKFKKWKRPYFGMLIFIGPAPELGGTLTNILAEEIGDIQAGFATAQVRRFKFSG